MFSRNFRWIKFRAFPRFHAIFVRWNEGQFRFFSSFHVIYVAFNAQCGNYGNFLSHIFDKNFVKATVLLNKLLKSWFHEIFFQWERISQISTLCNEGQFRVIPLSRLSRMAVIYTVTGPLWSYVAPGSLELSIGFPWKIVKFRLRTNPPTVTLSEIKTWTAFDFVSNMQFVSGC